MDKLQIETIAQTLRARGGRMTAQRRLIFATLASSSDHPTAEEILERASQAHPDLNLSTVYRTLRWLEQAGLVNSRVFEGEPRQERFDPVGQRKADHYHFRCRRCNRIVEFASPLVEAIKDQFSGEYGAEIESASLTLYGLCADCRAE